MATVFVIQDLLATDMGMIHLSASFRYQQFISLSELFGQQAIKLIFQPNGHSLAIRLLFSHVLTLGSATSKQHG
jgi:hypothetical protein